MILKMRYLFIRQLEFPPEKFIWVKPFFNERPQINLKTETILQGLRVAQAAVTERWP